MKKLALFAAASFLPLLSHAAQPQSSPPPAQSRTAQSSQGVFMGLGGSVRSDDAAIYLPIELSPAFRIEPFFAWSETDTSESRQAGAGGFFRFDVVEQLQAYGGGRLSFVELESGVTELDGFRVEPAVGLEFWVTNRFSLALEAFLYREDLDGSSGGLAVESESTGSDTRLLVRFFP